MRNSLLYVLFTVFSNSAHSKIVTNQFAAFLSLKVHIRTLTTANVSTLWIISSDFVVASDDQNSSI